MAERHKSFERCLRILEYLRWNTDLEHRISHAEMQRDPELGPYVKDIDTLKSCVYNMAQALDSNEAGDMLPSDQWKIFYKDFSQEYGDSDDVDEAENEEEPQKADKTKSRPPIRELYYRHTFSYEEINAMIEGVLFSRTLSTLDANRIVKKIEDHLTTKFYKKGPKNICKIQETVVTDRDRLRENMLLIQQAIDDRVQISFRFNRYNREKNLQPVRESKDTVSPYYIVANGGRYYLLACREGKSSMSIWRVDLMTEMEIPGRTEDCKGVRAIDKRDVANLPQKWDEAFPLQHLNMDFGEPKSITLRIKKDVPYTFLYDWFGKTFVYKFTEKEYPYGDIVQVLCPSFSMVNWALQYSDRVEVLEPKEVRDEVAEKVRNLKEKYLKEE